MSQAALFNAARFLAPLSDIVPQRAARSVRRSARQRRRRHQGRTQCSSAQSVILAAHWLRHDITFERLPADAIQSGHGPVLVRGPGPTTTCA